MNTSRLKIASHIVDNEDDFLLSSRDANNMSWSMPNSNKFHFEQFSLWFVIVYTNYCVDSFEHLHLGKGPFTHWLLFGGGATYINKYTEHSTHGHSFSFQYLL